MATLIICCAKAKEVQCASQDGSNDNRIDNFDEPTLNFNLGNGDNSESSMSSEVDAESEESLIFKRKFYQALMNTIPAKLTTIFNDFNKFVEDDQLGRYSDYQQTEQGKASNRERGNTSSGSPCPSSSHDQDSLVQTHGSSNCVIKPIKFNHSSPQQQQQQQQQEKLEGSEFLDESSNLLMSSDAFEEEEVQGMIHQSHDNLTANESFGDEIGHLQRQSSSESLKMRSNSPYVRASRVNSVDSTSFNALEATVNSALESEITEAQLSLFNEIDSLASESLQEIGHVGLFILSQLVTVIRQIPLEPGMDSLQQSSDLLVQLTEVYERVIAYLKNRRLEYQELIQWCLNATLVDENDADRFRIVRDALLLLFLYNAYIFDDEYLLSRPVLYSFKTAATYATLRNYYDTLEYIRQIYHFSNLTELQDFFELPVTKNSALEASDDSFLTLRQVNLVSSALTGSLVQNQTTRTLKKSSNKKSKKQKKPNQSLIDRPNSNSLSGFLVANPGMCMATVILAVLLHIIFFR